PLDDYAQGEVHIRVGLVGDIPSPAELSVSFDGAEATPVQVEIDGQEASFTTRVPQPRLWSPQSPELHTLRIDLAGHEPTAGCQARFGLRKIEARDGKLWLNGQQLTLKGYNRHEWHPNSGPTTPTLQMVADLQYLRDLGCNFVRGSHYPQDQRFLDLCDEMGFLVWEENLGWGQRERTLTSPTFHQQHDKSLRAMMHASHNHPSVIIWGFLNEAGSNEAYSRPIFEQTVATIRQLDSSRLVSFASMFVLKDLNFDLVDLIAINIYPGWYGCEYCEEPLSLIAPHMEKCFAHVSSPELKDKPIIVSEIGAEALYGWREAHNDFYTEEYQAQYLKTACEEALGHERCSGIALWHFSDARTYGGGLSMKRPRTFNNKGTLDEYRRPKAAYRSVREVFHRYPDTPAS
ncbi:MAG: glycoside hydrolase family 2 protein, partial [Puniceicoccales bacterium]